MDVCTLIHYVKGSLEGHPSGIPKFRLIRRLTSASPAARKQKESRGRPLSSDTYAYTITTAKRIASDKTLTPAADGIKPLLTAK